MRREDLEVKRTSLSDSKIIGYLEQELTLSKSMLRDIKEILRIVNTFDEEKLNTAIRDSLTIKDNISQIQESLLSYISRTSPALYHREDWIRITSKLGNVVDKMSGAIYRLEFLVKNRWEITGNIQDKLIKLTEAVEEIINEYVNVLNLLIL